MALPNIAAAPQPEPSVELVELVDYLQIMRRRWLVLIVGVCAGAIAGWLSAPGTSPAPIYAATHTLLAGGVADSGVNLEQAALRATTGPVPERVANRLGLELTVVEASVRAQANSTVAALTVTATHPDGALAVALADATAEELLNELTGGAVRSYEDEMGRLTRVLDAARAAVTQLEAAAPSPTRDADLQLARARLASAELDLREQTAGGTPGTPLVTIDAAKAIPVGRDGVQAPTSHASRATLLAGFGLLLGLGAAYGLDRLDTRVRSKGEAEAAFGFPVVAEIPPLDRRSRKTLALSHPATPFVESYRALRTVVGQWHPDDPRRDDGNRVIVVTSPLRGDGKTTTVAHLGAMLAEVGRSVLVVSGDFRLPLLHHFFGRTRSPGLTEALAGTPGTPGHGDLDRTTAVPGVALLASGAPVDNPAPLLEATGALFATERQHNDFVIVDSPPALVANDAAGLAQAADGVLLVARAGRTTVDAAQRTADIFRRLDVPVIGVVLVAAPETSTSYRDYGHSYRGGDATPSRRGRRRAEDATKLYANSHPPILQPALAERVATATTEVIDLTAEEAPWQRDPELEWRVSGRGVVVSLPDGDVLLDRTGSAIWDLLDQPTLPGEVGPRVRAANRKIPLGELEERFDSMRRMGLLQRS